MQHLIFRRRTAVSWLIALGFYLVAADRAHAVAVTGATLVGNPITFENGGIPNGTTVSFTLDTPGTVELDVFNANTNTQVGTVTQTVSGTSGNIFWNAIWLIPGQDPAHAAVFGRIGGNYQLVLKLTSGSTVSAPFSVPTLVTVNSVDIHNVGVVPSFDTNGLPTFPYLITYDLAKTSIVSASIANSSGTVVRTLLSNVQQFGETISTGSVTWNGLNDTGQSVPLGLYTLTVTASDPNVNGSQAIPRNQDITVGSLAGPGANPQTVFAQGAYVFPNPVRGGQATFRYQAVRDNATITLKIYTIDGTLVLSQTFTGIPAGSTNEYDWDVTNQSGKKVGRGLYFYVFKETDSVGTLQTVKKLAVIR